MSNLTFNITSFNWSRPHYVVWESPWYMVKMKLLAAGGSLSLIGGVVGCILGLIVIYRNRNKKRFAFLAICCSLLISCLLYKCLSLAFKFPTWYHKNGWIYGTAMCKISMFMMHINQASIPYHFILISIYVIICIRNPNLSRKMDQSRTITIILATLWVVLFVLNAENLAAYSNYNGNNTYIYCYPDRYYSGYLAVIIINSLFFFLVPILMLFILSIVICVSARKRRNNRYIDMDNEDERHLQEFVVITVVLTVVHCVVVLPSIIYHALGQFGHHDIFYIMRDIQMFIVTFYPAVIPYVILLSLKDFRTTLRQLFGCSAPVKAETKYEEDPVCNNTTNAEC